MTKPRQPVVVLQNPKAPKRLSSLAAVRLELSAVYRAMRENLLPVQDGTKLAYVLGQLASIIELETVEKRICALEKQVKTNEQIPSATP